MKISYPNMDKVPNMGKVLLRYLNSIILLLIAVVHHLDFISVYEKRLFILVYY